jgi:hypothetical protein
MIPTLEFSYQMAKQVINIMRIKKFTNQKTQMTMIKEFLAQKILNFNEKQEITGPVTRAMKKLLEQQNATKLAISVLCDLTKQHCSTCEWEQECSDNPLLFNPDFARQYIAERKSWLINKQSMCAKCKLQLGEHLIDHQIQFISNAIISIKQMIVQKEQSTHFKNSIPKN